MRTSTAVSAQWANRPADERFLSLESLREMVVERTNRAVVASEAREKMHVAAVHDELYLETTATRSRFTNWSMSQLATVCGAPPKFLSLLSADLAADCLNYRLSAIERDDHLLLLDNKSGENTVGSTVDGVIPAKRDISDTELRAITSPGYGRIWDINVLDSLLVLNHDGRWKVPSASYQEADPLRATTLYGSDRDIFVFLCDPDNPVEINGKPKYRGFIVANSEVGSMTFWVAMFLYDRVCDNRIIWGISMYEQLRKRHTISAPVWFVTNGAKVLSEYANSGTGQEVKRIKGAKALTVGDSTKSVVDFTVNKTKLNKRYVEESLKLGEELEGDPTKLWTVVSGLTAKARTIPNSDSRVYVEVAAGKLLDLVR